MCWSPTADLVAGGFVGALGVASVASVHRARDLPLAALPLILGAHQAMEAVVWRNADASGGQAVGDTAAVLWAVIAFPLLPAWVSLAVFYAAGHWSRIRLVPFAVIGLATSAALAYGLASEPVTAGPVGHTMHYGVHIPLGVVAVIGYLLATIGSLLASDQPEIRVLGFVSGVGALLCYVVWRAGFVSTWCALAAVASALVLRWVRRPRVRRPAPDPFRRSRVPAP